MPPREIVRNGRVGHVFRRIHVQPEIVVALVEDRDVVVQVRVVVQRRDERARGIGWDAEIDDTDETVGRHLPGVQFVFEVGTGTLRSTAARSQTPCCRR